MHVHIHTHTHTHTENHLVASYYVGRGYGMGDFIADIVFSQVVCEIMASVPIACSHLSLSLKSLSWFVSLSSGVWTHFQLIMTLFANQIGIMYGTNLATYWHHSSSVRLLVGSVQRRSRGDGEDWRERERRGKKIVQIGLKERRKRTREQLRRVEEELFGKGSSLHLDAATLYVHRS